MNKNVVFFVNQICGRGSTDMIYNYAKYNQIILNNNSKILTLKNHKYKHNSFSIEIIKKEIEIIQIDNYSQIDNFKKNVDVFYGCKFGNKDDMIMSDVKNVIHAVFPAFEPHGDEYLLLCKHYAKILNWDKYLEPIIDYKTLIHDENWRKKYNTEEEDIIFGRSGGYDSFDIPFVKDLIIEIVNNYKNIKFWFTNTEPFYEHENIKYFNFLNKHDLFCFINSCDAMLHARLDGECFGIALSEFSICNKPIITYTESVHKAHLDYLSKYYGYKNKEELKQILLNFKKISEDYNFFKEFTPEKIIQKFNSYL